MNQRTRALYWQALGGACYLLGLMIFLLVIAGVYFAPPERSLANVAPAHLAAMGVGVGLVLVGRAITWRLGLGDAGWTGVFDGDPNRSRLEELGYNVPPEETPEDDDPWGYEDGEVTLRCPECGARNDPGYRFCGNCSAELPDV